MVDYPEIGIAKLYFDEGNGVTAETVLWSIADRDIITFNILIWKYDKIVNLRFNPINYVHNVEIERVSFWWGDKEVYSVSGAAFLDGVRLMQEFTNLIVLMKKELFFVKITPPLYIYYMP